MWSYNYSTPYLAHHGILGMKWGVRRYQNADGSLTAAGKRRYKADESYTLDTKSGDKIRMVRYRGGAGAEFLRRISPKIAEEQDKTLNYKIYNSQGKTVGSYQGYLKSPEEFNTVWADTKKNFRGRGYMQAVVQQGEAIARKYGRTKMTAELVGNSPDIHRIVLDKQGYIKVGEDKTKEIMDLWGGLTFVEKHL